MRDNLLTRSVRFLAIAAVALSMTACASIQGAPSVLDEGKSPRRTTTAGIETTIGVFDKLTLAAKLGALPDNFLDDVGQFAPDAEEVAVAYLDATAACVVIDGALQTDPQVGRVCERNAVKRAFGDLSALVNQAIERVGPGTDTGRALLIASFLLEKQLRPASGDVWSGYEKEPDMTLEEFNLARGALRTSFDAFVDAAANALVVKQATK